MFWCYLLFKVHYGSMDRTFVNPLGSASAIFGILYFGTLVISLLFVQLDFHALMGFAPLMILSIVYYYKVVEARQFFSKEEQQKFMKAYILNANRKKKKGLSPFMKKVRWLYETLGLSVCCGAWTMGLPGGRDNSSIASSNASKTSSKVSAAKFSISLNGSKSVSELKPLDEECSLAASENARAPLEEGDVSVDNAGNRNSHSKKNSFRIVPMVGRLTSNTVDASISSDPEKQDDNAIVPLTSSALAAVSKAHDNGEQPAVTWSGKLLTEQESRQFFEIINQRPPSHHGSAAASVHSNHDGEGDPEADLVARMPDKFSVSPHVRSKIDLISAALGDDAK
jgi:hypothetical protein